MPLTGDQHEFVTTYILSREFDDERRKERQKAKILGFDNYASWSLQGTMASTPDKYLPVNKFGYSYSNRL